ncbi:N(4)-(Beta-N-acetylglucosaminyl)-L-asparaginase [Bulinus truncatus]|nr:N(4)-(Beta-N-acetylglucosaminyl)-L-asparaginase [Bulinus truncatus]
MSEISAVGTWAFSEGPVCKAFEIMSKCGTSLDAVESGINIAETDPNYGKYHVGCAGWNNSENVLELDAAIMDGRDLDFGSVTALQSIPQAISVARKVMSNSQHNMLTGHGASLFAKSQGFKHQTNLGTKSEAVSHECPLNIHDTLGLLAMDNNGNLCAAAESNGDGDEILKYCPSYKVVDLLKQNHSPHDACQLAVKEIVQRRNHKNNFQLVIIALDKKGKIGAANVGVHTWTDIGTGRSYPGFPYVVAAQDLDGGTVVNVASATV